MAMTDESSPAYLPGFFQIAYGTIRDANRIFEAAATGDGLGWHDHNSDVHVGCERFFRPGYLANLTASWLPALDGVVDKLENGARVADMGCGHGSSSVLMAQAYPGSRIHGSDYHGASIDVARERAQEAGVAERTEFEVAGADGFSGTGFDLVTTFDALHDMGDPVGAARHVYDALADDGTWMVVEPAAGDHVEDNFYTGRPGVLRLLDAALHPSVAVPGGRARARYPGRPGQDPRRRDRRRVHPVPDRRADPAQHHLRDPQVGRIPAGARRLNR